MCHFRFVVSENVHCPPKVWSLNSVSILYLAIVGYSVTRFSRAFSNF